MGKGSFTILGHDEDNDSSKLLIQNRLQLTTKNEQLPGPEDVFDLGEDNLRNAFDCLDFGSHLNLARPLKLTTRAQEQQG